MDTDVDEACTLTLDDMIEIADSFNEFLDKIYEQPDIEEMIENQEIEPQTGFFRKVMRGIFGKRG